MDKVVIFFGLIAMALFVLSTASLLFSFLVETIERIKS